MKLFIITSRVPYPLDKGDKLRIFHQIKYLSQFHDITLCCLDDSSTTDYQELKKICELHVFKLNKFFIILNLFKAFFNQKPFQVNYFFQYKIKRQIENLIRKNKPDHIYCQLIRCAEYVKHIHDIPKTLDYMDTFSKGMERRIDKSVFWKKPFIISEHQRLLRYENLIFDYFEHKTIISKQDLDCIFHQKRNEIHIIKNGVDTTYFNIQDKAKKEYDIVFIGNLNYPPNIQACKYIAETIVPLLNENATILFSGASPAKEVLELKSKQITVNGWIEDIRTAYSSAKIFVAPMFSGTGLQNKLLEAMASGIPCITTPLANNALNGTHLENIYIANDEQEFYSAISELLSNPTLLNKLANKGRNFVEENYSWDSSNKELNNIITKNTIN